jgi:hypothetical protein
MNNDTTLTRQLSSGSQNGVVEPSRQKVDTLPMNQVKWRYITYTFWTGILFIAVDRNTLQWNRKWKHNECTTDYWVGGHVVQNCRPLWPRCTWCPQCDEIQYVWNESLLSSSNKTAAFQKHIAMEFLQAYTKMSADKGLKEMYRRVARLNWRDVSKEHVASIFRIE